LLKILKNEGPPPVSSLRSETQVVLSSPFFVDLEGGARLTSPLRMIYSTASPQFHNFLYTGKRTPTTDEVCAALDDIKTNYPDLEATEVSADIDFAYMSTYITSYLHTTSSSLGPTIARWRASCDRRSHIGYSRISTGWSCRSGWMTKKET
jgi:hypothetical protein